MQDFEKLGVFYLGREFDLKGKKASENLLLYDSKDLVTHAVCVGMTGSGKTGLCLALLEEAAIDGIPAIIVDPKGDLGNLLLTFPNLRAEDFRPWINDDDAHRKGLSPDEFAAQQAQLWKSGLEAWGQSVERIQKLRDAADFAIYTPGSSAGLPVSILQSFAAPPATILDDMDSMRERISTTATSLLGLLGIDADPVKSREHILISTLLNHFWKQSQSLDLATLIQAIQKPPVSKVGVFDLESFYPAKERFELAMRLNNLLAAPGFQAWLEGEPLDIHRMLYTSTGKPRHAIFSIAHLSDAERMFFVSLLLSQTLGWMRSQPGTTSLRAIFYMDEVFGYMPPVANPPSKAPLLTLLKQGRAFGLGVVLATQNPVDLDYKGLSNAGTWFLGRLQTERDQARVLDGLEGASTSSGAKFDRNAVQQILAGLGSRVFLMNNVHDDEPVVFETRWVMSYLRGPLTRMQIKSLMENRRQTPTTPSSVPLKPAESGTATPPAVPPDVPQVFLPIRGRMSESAQLLYRPYLLGAATVRFSDARKKIDLADEVVRLFPIVDEAVPIKWNEATDAGVPQSDLANEGEANASFAALPSAACQSKSYAAWKKEIAEQLYREHKLELLKSPSTGETSRPNESEREFRIRLLQLAHEHRDVWVEKTRAKYAPKIASLQEKIRRAEERLERERAQSQQQKLQTAISVGTTLLGAFLGRKAVSRSSLGRATTAMRGTGRAMRESQDVDRAEENLEVLQQQLVDLEQEFKAETEAQAAAHDPQNEVFERIIIRPKKADVAIQLVALAWVP